MPRRPDRHPENALTLALILAGGAILAVVILTVLSVTREDGSTRLIPYGIALAAAAGAAAWLILARARRTRRKERPQWLETQAWQQGLHEQVKKGTSEDDPERKEH